MSIKIRHLDDTTNEWREAHKEIMKVYYDKERYPDLVYEYIKELGKCGLVSLYNPKTETILFFKPRGSR